jgi:hypothetical protein
MDKESCLIWEAYAGGFNEDEAMQRLFKHKRDMIAKAAEQYHEIFGELPVSNTEPIVKTKWNVATFKRLFKSMAQPKLDMIEKLVDRKVTIGELAGWYPVKNGAGFLDIWIRPAIDKDVFAKNSRETFDINQNGLDDQRASDLKFVNAIWQSIVFEFIHSIPKLVGNRAKKIEVRNDGGFVRFIATRVFF